MQAIKNIPDAVIIDTLQRGKSMDEAVKALYRDHFESLAWFVMNNSGSWQDAEDIFQDVVVSFIDLVKKEKFRGEASIKTFLFAMNKNTWLNELKRRGKAGQRELKYEKEQDKPEMDTTHFIADSEATKQVMDLVGELGDTCKKILVMFYYENLSMKEILDGLEYENEQVVRNKKYKCLKQLEQMITANPALKQNLKNLLHG